MRREGERWLCCAANPAACQWLGTSHAALLHQSLRQVIPELETQGSFGGASAVGASLRAQSESLCSGDAQLSLSRDGRQVDCAFVWHQTDELLVIEWQPVRSQIQRGLIQPGGTQAAAGGEDERLSPAQWAAMGRVAGGIAHDFNNCLSALVYLVEGLRSRAEADAEGRTLFADLDRTVERARSLIKQILEFARADQWDRVPTSLGQICRDWLDVFSKTLPGNVTLTADIEPEALVLAEPTQMEQLLSNLVVNAVNASQDGERRVRVTLSRQVSNSPAGRWVLLQVSDDGCGIPPESLAQIFEPFFTTRRGDGGTGLGLAIVQGIVNAHGGQISVESGLGSGTQVSVYLPLAEQHDPRVD